MLYIVGEVLFLSNIVQFGTDQLRDAPTRYSVYYISAYVWIDGIGNLIASSAYIFEDDTVVEITNNKIAVDRTKGVLMCIVILISIVLISVVLYIVHRKKFSLLFLLERNQQNPYKLACSVLYYSLQHKNPTRRSAFTFCEDEKPSRIDFSKQRYGGPFSTEQVEDVKAMLNISIVILSFSPIFLLETASVFTFKDFIHSIHKHFFLALSYEFVIPITTIVCIPLFHCVKKLISPKYTPNMFKRMGIAFIILVIMFVMYLLHDSIAYDDHIEMHYMNIICRKNENTTYLWNKTLFRIPSRYMSIPQQMLFAIYRVMLYTSAYEFICCQSPQHMKGLLFGLFYALRAFFQCLSAATIYLFIYHWSSSVLSCGTAYYIFALSIAALSIMVYIIVARRFKYRKRDDFCNVYKFAEDYYSNIQ